MHPSELARINEVLEEAARRDLAQARWPAGPSSTAMDGRRGPLALALALVLVSGGIAFAATRASDPGDDVLGAATGLGAPAPRPGDAIRLGPYSVWPLEGRKGSAVAVTRSAAEPAPLIVGCGAEPPPRAISVCGGIQARGERSVMVGRAAPDVASIEARFTGGRRGRAVVGKGYFVVEGPSAIAPSRLGERPIRILGRDSKGRVIGEARP